LRWNGAITEVKGVEDRILTIATGCDGQFWLGGNFKLAKEKDGKFSYLQVPEIEDDASVHAIGEDTAGG